ncbi:MAG TPA: hypothetical protein VD994_18055, partial [Prosthecobacter sp.]|nr:hypothetical protein [Prosthecobacter sp.]
MPDFPGLSGPLNPDPMAADPSDGALLAPTQPKYNVAALLDVFKKFKEDCFSTRWVWEREWLRDIWYVTGRQWIYYHPTRREWVDKRLQKNVPKPVTNKVAEIVQSLRASFGAIDLGVVARPIGHNPQAVATAEIVDKISPLLHNEHRMNQVMREADFWLIVTGNAILQISWDQDTRFNRVFVPFEQCTACGTVSSPADIKAAGDVCPACGANQFIKAEEPDEKGSMKPMGEWRAYGRGKTSALSPFEWAVPSNVTRFDEVPGIIRLRWRDKS